MKHVFGGVGGGLLQHIRRGAGALGAGVQQQMLHRWRCLTTEETGAAPQSRSPTGG